MKSPIYLLVDNVFICHDITHQIDGRLQNEALCQGLVDLITNSPAPLNEL